MIDTKVTKHATLIALDAYRDQYDNGGSPYVMHPLHVAESMDTEDECVVALLHDVLKDTEITVDDLQQWGITDRQIEALKLLYHDETMPYLEYILNLRTDPIAVKVKIADLRHDSDLTRLPKVTAEDRKRVVLYQKALQLLQAE